MGIKITISNRSTSSANDFLSAQRASITISFPPNQTLSVSLRTKVVGMDDIDWERQRINFRSPKTEHHDDKDRREIPIFPEVVQPLHEVHEQAKPGERRVLPWLENITSAATRKPLIKAIKLAGEEPREKLWTALRATRDTELREQHPAFVVDAWLGHDDLIAKRHYTQTLDRHFDAAVGSSAHHFCSQSDPHSVAQRPDTPQNPAEKRTVSHGQAIEWAKRDLNLSDETLQNKGSGELLASPRTTFVANLETDPDLAAIIEQWPDLPEAIKAGIVAMVRAAGDAE